jgi:hypothetical protein
MISTRNKLKNIQGKDGKNERRGKKGKNERMERVTGDDDKEGINERPRGNTKVN